MSPSDACLMRRVQQRDAGAFELFSERYRDRVRRYLVTVTRDASAAEDLAQEAFLRVWTHADQWDGRGAPRSWLFRMALRLGLNHLRAVGRRRECSLDICLDALWEAPEQPARSPELGRPGPEELLELAERQGTLWRLVGRLPQEKREVLRLMVVEEMDLESIAEALGVPVGTVKSRLHYARKRLAREWESWGTE